MDGKRFQIGDALSFGWEIAKANIGFFVAFLLLIWLAQVICNGPSGYYWGKYYFWSPIFSLLGLVVGVFINIAMVRVTLRFNHQETAELADLWMGYPQFLDFLVGSILYGLLVFAGLILCIIPGIYWGIKYQFYGYCIMDRNVGPVEGIKMSGRLTQGSWWNLFWLGVLQGCVVLLGMLACIVGLFWAVPTAMIAHGYAYVRLAAADQQAMGMVAPPQVTPPQVTPPQPQPPQV
jgi:uncharacterized membrane protein